MLLLGYCCGFFLKAATIIGRLLFKQASLCHWQTFSIKGELSVFVFNSFTAWIIVNIKVIMRQSFDVS